MSNHFHALKVKSVRKTTADCSIVSLDIPVELHHAFSFKQGQYLTLRAEINGESVQRSYSLCSVPEEEQWQVGIKKVPNGKFSTYANEVLKSGDTLDVMEPNGRFFVEVAPSEKKNYVAFAAGSGITPIYSIIRTHLEQESKASFKLFYVNQTVGSIILREEIEALKNRFMERFEVYHFLTKESRSMPLFEGRIDEGKLKEIGQHILDFSKIDHVFSCGPEEMILNVRDFMLANGITEEKIHFELFNTSGATIETKDYSQELAGLVSKVTIQEGGKSFNFDIAQGSNNILDAALNAGADLPFACKGGVCCTCRAKLVEGDIDMRVNYALEKDEVENGYILTCQAIPKSERVVVDFDS